MLQTGDEAMPGFEALSMLPKDPSYTNRMFRTDCPRKCRKVVVWHLAFLSIRARLFVHGERPMQKNKGCVVLLVKQEKRKWRMIDIGWFPLELLWQSLIPIPELAIESSHS
jgi:hypothetical protein